MGKVRHPEVHVTVVVKVAPAGTQRMTEVRPFPCHGVIVPVTLHTGPGGYLLHCPVFQIPIEIIGHYPVVGNIGVHEAVHVVITPAYPPTRIGMVILRHT